MLREEKPETKENTIQEKLDYIGLNLKDIPDFLMEVQNLNYKAIKNYDEKQYKRYEFVNVNDITILLSPTNRLDDVKDKYENARPLCCYLDEDSEENFERYTTFMKMLKKVKISDIEAVEKEQENIAKKIPFKVKFNGNYLWQIYYSESSEQYFMLVPTEDKDYSTCFYLLKKQLEENENNEIFVPISYADYSGKILKKSLIKDLENYLWIFTKDYPSIYEVTDRKGRTSLEIVGETQVFEKIKTLYKMSFASPKDAMRFYKLVKVFFILQTELSGYFDFSTSIDEESQLEFYYNDVKIEYDNLLDFIEEQYIKSIGLKNSIISQKDILDNKLIKLKEEIVLLEQEYLEKEKQISTFLECKKTFFGKMKYFFKVGKKKKNDKKERIEDVEDVLINEKYNKNEKFELGEKNCTLDELVKSFKELEKLEIEHKNTVMDINALKLKSKNLKKKIENATSYIDEINKHKKSIFEFWKYSNKDAVATLEEGEKEEDNIKKIEKVFNYEDEFESFGENVDKEQRRVYTDGEMESVFVSNTNILGLMNKMYKKEAENKEFSEMLRWLKTEKQLEKEEKDEDDEDIDIFGKLSDDITKERSIGNKTHREIPRDIYQILDIRKETRGIEFKRTIEQVIKNVLKAIKKNELKDDMYVYKASMFEINFDDIEKVSLDIEKEVENILNKERSTNKIYLYKIKLPKGTNYSAFSNIIFYDNKNMTLPVGMNFSSSILVNFKKMKLLNEKTKEIKKSEFEKENDDFSKIIVKDIVVKEMSFEKKIVKKRSNIE